MECRTLSEYFAERYLVFLAAMNQPGFMYNRFPGEPVISSVSENDAVKASSHNIFANTKANFTSDGLCIT